MSEREPIYLLNNDFVPKSEASVPVMDLGWIRGYGVFDYLITYRGQQPFKLADHITRLKNSSALIGLEIPWSNVELENLARETIDRNTREREKAIRIVVTGGVSPDSISPGERPTLAVFVDDLKPYPGEYYQRGVAIITANHRRFLPEAKSLNYLFAIMALQEAKRKGAIEAVYVDEQRDVVFEGTTSNVFIVRNGKIVTPRIDILPGITRKVILGICSKDFGLTEADVSIADLFVADEVFLTASNKEVMPVTKIDGFIVGDGNVGPITREIMGKFRNFTSEEDW